MTAKELEQIRILNDAIKQRMDRIDRLKDSLLPGSVGYDNNGASKASPRDGMADVFAMIDHEERKLNELIELFVLAKEDATRAINQLTNETERTILILHYVCLYSWRRIARGLNKDVRTVFRIRNKALSNLQHIA